MMVTIPLVISTTCDQGVYGFYSDGFKSMMFHFASKRLLFFS